MTHTEGEPGEFDGNEDFGGENPGTDLRRAFARHANKMLKHSGAGKDTNIVIELGEGQGAVPINRVRFRDATKEGNLKAYILQEASDPKVVVTTVIAIGAVAAGLNKLKNSKR